MCLGWTSNQNSKFLLEPTNWNKVTIVLNLYDFYWYTSFDFMLICLFSNSWYRFLTQYDLDIANCDEVRRLQEDFAIVRPICQTLLHAGKQISTWNAKKRRNWLNTLSLMYCIQINDNHFNTVWILFSLNILVKKK